MKEILNSIIATFEDARLSDDEKKLLVDLLYEKELYTQDIGYLRNQLFCFAKEALRTTAPIAVINWLEKVSKISRHFIRP